MGIKFLCPNGHKLHVKSFLSGKKAICPKCGARVVVPQQEDATANQNDPASAIDDTWTDAGVEASSIQSGPASSAPSAPAVAASEVPVIGDAIAESPSSVWYVRPATGGQFGPASGEIMRAWLGEGRVGASSLVWRAGWTEWRAASAVFPQLGGPSAPPGVAPVAPVGLTSQTSLSESAGGNGPIQAQGSSLSQGQVVQSVPVMSPQPGAGDGLSTAGMIAPGAPLTNVRKRRKRNDSQLIVSGVLAGIVFVLVIILFWVWSRSDAPEPAVPEETDAESTL